MHAVASTTVTHTQYHAQTLVPILSELPLKAKLCISHTQCLPHTAQLRHVRLFWNTKAYCEYVESPVARGKDSAGSITLFSKVHNVVFVSVCELKHSKVMNTVI